MAPPQGDELLERAPVPALAVAHADGELRVAAVNAALRARLGGRTLPRPGTALAALVPAVLTHAQLDAVQAVVTTEAAARRTDWPLGGADDAPALDAVIEPWTGPAGERGAVVWGLPPLPAHPATVEDDLASLVPDDLADLDHLADDLWDRAEDLLEDAAWDEAWDEAVESGLALAVQDALLPRSLPLLPDLDLAAAHLPGVRPTRAGGDFFDVLALPDGDVVLVVGEVPGHGVEACLQAAALRLLVRDRLLEGSDLGQALAVVESRTGSSAQGRGTTLALLRLDPRDGRFSHASAGHPTPLVVGPDGAFRHLEPAPGAPLGAGSRHLAREDRLGPGEMVLLYTDGLLDRVGRAVTGATAALGRDVAAARAALPREEARRTAREVALATLELAVEAPGHPDDVTVVAAAVEPPPLPLHREGVATSDSAKALREDLEAWLQAVGARPLERIAVVHAADELLRNVVAHAYADGPRPAGDPRSADDGDALCLDARLLRGGVVRVEVADRGRWREPGEGADDGTPSRGLGVAAGLVRSLVVERRPTGTTAVLEHPLTRVTDVFRRDLVPEVAEPGVEVAEVDDAVRIDVVAEGGGRDRLVLVGAVGPRGAQDLREALLEEGWAGLRDLDLDLGGVTHLGTAAVQAVLEAQDRARTHGSALRLVAPRGGVAHHVLTRAGLATDPA